MMKLYSSESAISVWSWGIPITAPVGFPGEQRYRSWQRCQTSSDTASKSGRYPLPGSQLM